MVTESPAKDWSPGRRGGGGGRGGLTDAATLIGSAGTICGGWRDDTLQMEPRRGHRRRRH